jgi:DNA-binding response OmpR family regulator
VTRIDGPPPVILRRVVVADDEIHILDLLTCILEDQGYAVIAASNGESAYRAVLEHNPALVMSDVMMPGLRGDELCRRLKESPTTATIPVVLVTSLPTTNFDYDCADAFIAKPFDIDHVESVVVQLVGR